MLSRNLDKKFQKKKVLLLLFSILGGFLSGFFGSGGGILLVLAFLKLFHEEEKKSAYALSGAMLFPVSIFTFFQYFGKMGKIAPSFSLPHLLFYSFLGGLVGAFFLKKMKERFTRKFFSALLILGGFLLLFKQILS